MEQVDKEYILQEMLEECLRSMNQEGSSKVISYDSGRNKILIEFDVVEIEEDNYIGFAGY